MIIVAIDKKVIFSVVTLISGTYLFYLSINENNV